MKKSLFEGPIPSTFIAESIAKHQSKTSIGAHQIFLGQVRNDIIDDKEVTAIEYSGYEEMAEKTFHDIREGTFDKFDITCMHIHHSVGTVNVGELSLFVFVSSKHRDVVQKAIVHIVEEIKEKAPIFGKELFGDASHAWKENK